jgi:predicted nucleotidyltransferase
VLDKEALKTVTGQVVDAARRRFGDSYDSAILYGSYARDDYDEDSDVDIMVLANISRQEADRLDMEMARTASRLSLENEVTVTVVIRDKPTFEDWKDVVPFYGNVATEGVLLSA